MTRLTRQHYQRLRQRVDGWLTITLVHETKGGDCWGDGTEPNRDLKRLCVVMVGLHNYGLRRSNSTETFSETPLTLGLETSLRCPITPI